MEDGLIIFFLLLAYCVFGCIIRMFTFAYYTRMHAATKSGTVGVMGIVIAMMIQLDDASVIFRGILVILFFLLTAPVAAHMIGRSAYRSGIALWDKSSIDEYKNKK